MTRTNTEQPAGRGERRRRDILDAAGRLMVSEGHSALTLRRIARELGIGLSHVQYYFASTASIVEALLSAHLRETTERIRLAGAGASSTRALEVVLQDQKSVASCRVMWELWALSAHDQAVADHMTAFYRDYAQAVLPHVLALNPCLPVRGAALRAVLITALLEGLSLFRGAGRRPLVPPDLLDAEILRAVEAIAGSAAASAVPAAHRRARVKG